MTTQSNALAMPVTASEMIDAFEECKATIERCFHEIREAERKLNEKFSTAERYTDVSICTREVRFENPSETIYKLNLRCWDRLIDRLNVRGLVSIAEWKKLQDQMVERPSASNPAFPMLSHASAQALYKSLVVQHDTLHADAMREVFDLLRPQRSKLKTNDKCEIGTKVILEGWVELKWSSGFQLKYWRHDSAAAIERVFEGLQGKGTMHKSGHRSALELAIDSCVDGEGETDLFRFKAHKNGSLHLTFKDATLPKKLTAQLGGKTFRKAA
jgi:hypothetical protein